MGSAVSAGARLNEEDVQMICGEMYDTDARNAFEAASSDGFVSAEAALAYARSKPALEDQVAKDAAVRAEMKKQSTRRVIEEQRQRPPEAPTPTAADKKRTNLTAFALEDHVKKTFPMMVMPIATFLELETMRPYEELLAEGKIFEWDEAKGPVFFLSHQWTSFDHPDHTGLQLATAKAVFRGLAAGDVVDRFTSEKEWEDWSLKDSIYARNFNARGCPTRRSRPGTSPPRRRGATSGSTTRACPRPGTRRTRASRPSSPSPHYIDAALTFMVLCPKIEHKEKAEACDYHSWRSRGWCRLEEQVNELKLFETHFDEEWMHGITKWDVPRRPLIVTGEASISTVDVMDHFYTLGLRCNSVLNGDFACCALNHEKTFADGSTVCIPCDKKRLKPFCVSLWERKCEHMKTASAFVQFTYFWRYKSHVTMMQAETLEDTPENTEDPALATLEDVKAKYNLADDGGMWEAYKSLMAMNWGMMKMPQNPDMRSGSRVDRHAADVEKNGMVNLLLTYMVAEGNLKMVKLLVEEHGADLSLGPFFVMITMLDFCATKGNDRVLRYILDTVGPEKAEIDRLSTVTHIAAVDRACKSGMLSSLDILVAHGAKVVGFERFNGETCAHSAAMHGHVHILKRLHELGVDMFAVTRNNYTGLGGGGLGAGKSALDYARQWNNSAAVAYLESLQYEVRPVEPTAAELP
ncbi:hypothetical protein JL720_1616 [Aureococcus anophagefferens]|nr:hypothetical protein JL720_1616 [Aureococcus anophagefferens]